MKGKKKVKEPAGMNIRGDLRSSGYAGKGAGHPPDLHDG